MTTPLPVGFAVEVDRDTRRLDETRIYGGSPARIVRLSAGGQRAWAELQHGPVASPESAALARHVTDAGIAHPCPPAVTGTLDVTVVIPVHDRPRELDRCLAALAGRYPVVVVDDASDDAAGIAGVCASHGAVLVRREVNGGPGAARDTGLRQVHTDYVALLDSDTEAPLRWIEDLAGHFADPLVAAVAPRVVGEAPDTWAGRYTRANSSLDLGERPRRVAPGSAVGYVPTAALLLRRAAIEDVSARSVFDPSLRVGEDVDLVWRLHEAGWRIRYEPRVQVRHEEPSTWKGLLTRRFRYGTSAAPLAERHPDAITPLVLHPWPTLAVVGLLLRRPGLATAAYAVSVTMMRRKLRRADMPHAGSAVAMADAARQTGLGIGRYVTQFGLPAVAALAASPRPAGRRAGRRAAAAALVLAPALDTWLRRRPDLDLPRYVCGQLMDDAAYGAGVWAGCLRRRTLRPVRPAVVIPTLPTQRAVDVSPSKAPIARSGRSSFRKVSRGHELV